MNACGRGLLDLFVQDDRAKTQFNMTTLVRRGNSAVAAAAA